ncbi:MAG: DUF1552 domain-containing protein [Acidobacteria bacterium]|nr:DUF1552 domain-containing protein [Acidobacteriota bacterium]
MKHINRRRFLQAAGVSIGLPWLEASETRPPTRFATLFFPNGVSVAEWGATGEGPAMKLKGLLSPLELLKHKLIVPSGLWHERLEQRPGHDGKTSGFLTGVENYKLEGNRLKLGVSIDQLIARSIGNETPLPSLCLGIKPDTTTQLDLIPIFRSYISWAAESQPAPKEIDPRFAFDRLFDNGERARRNKSILDAVLDQAKSMRTGVSGQDGKKLDEFFESVRDVEKRVEKADGPAGKSRWQPASAPAPVRPTIRPDDREPHTRLMLDMIVLAFRMNKTRVATFMYDNGGCTGNFSFLPGVTEEWHAASHHRDRPEIRAQYEAINRWHVAQLAYLLKSMDEVDEGGESLLDHSMVLWGSGLADGNRHTADNLPLLFAGGGSGTLRTGRAVDYPKHTPFARLLISIASRMGVRVNSFADATQELSGLA